MTLRSYFIFGLVLSTMVTSGCESDRSGACPSLGNQFCHPEGLSCCPDYLGQEPYKPECVDGKWTCKVGTLGPDCIGVLPPCQSTPDAGADGGACPSLGNQFCYPEGLSCCPDYLGQEPYKPECVDGKWTCKVGTLGPDCIGVLPPCQSTPDAGADSGA